MATDYSDIIRGMASEEAGATVALQQGRNPADIARARRLSRYTGAPPVAIESNYAAYEAQVLRQNTEAAVRDNPWMAQYLGQPDNAAIAKKDIPALAKTSQLLGGASAELARNAGRFGGGASRDAIASVIGGQPLAIQERREAQTWNAPLDLRGAAARVRAQAAGENALEYEESGFAGRVGINARNIVMGALNNAAGGAAGAAQGYLDFAPNRFVLDRLGLGDDVDTYFAGEAAGRERIAERYTTPGLNRFGQAATSAATSLTSLGAAVLTGNPLAALSAVTGFESYARYRGQGASALEAGVGGVGNAAIEYITEKLPVGFLLGSFGKRGAGKFLGSYLLSDLGGELAATTGQTFIDAVMTGGEGVEDWQKNLPDRLIDTALSTVMMGGAIGGGSFIASRLQPQVRAMQDMEQGLASQQFVDRLMETAQTTEMRKLDPESYADFVEKAVEASGAPVKYLYLPVEAVDAYFQSEGADRDAFAPFATQIAEAQQTQGDIVIPIADAAAHFAGTPVWEAIRQDVRTAPGGLSGREAAEQVKTFHQELETRGAEIAAEAAAEGERMEPVVKLFDNLRNEMISAGYDERTASANAQILAARYERLTTERYGSMTLEQARERFPVDFRTASPGEGPARGAMSQDNPEFRKWFGASKAITEDGDPLELYHGTSEQFDAFAGNNFFSDDKAVAERFRDQISATYSDGRTGRVVSAYVKIERPFEIDMAGDFAANAQFGKARSVWEAALANPEYDGIILRNTKDEGNVFIPKKPTQIKSTTNSGTFDPDDPNMFNQDTADTVRGQAQIGSNGSAIITLFAQANRSTLIHELGHVFLEQEMALAAQPGASQELKEDIAKLKRWFAGNGHPVKGNKIPVEAHELFARGFERYVMEGKAPSADLRGVFATFRSWLLRIYQVVENLRSPITPDVREVFDRMLATQEAIEANRATAPALTDEALDKLGMTDAEKAAYRSSVTDARDEAYDALLFRTMEAVRRREQARLREVQSNIRDEVTAEVNARPEFVALHLLRTGRVLGQPDVPARDVKLNSGWLMDTYGEEVMSQLPKGLPITRGDGLPGDEIAEMVGMPDGDTLVKTLIGMRAQAEALKASGDKRSVRQVMIDNRVEEIMAERYGDVLTDGRIEEEAIAAINGARQGEILAGELRQLGKRAPALQRQATPYQIAREWARRKIIAGRVLDVASRSAIQRYARGAAKAAKAAEEAILADDMTEAFRQKQAQMLNHALLAEAKAAADQVDTIVRRMQRLAGRAAMKSVDQDYFDRVHELLERFDFRQRSQRQVAEQESFETWAAARQAEGFEVNVPPRLAGIGQHYSRTTVEDLLALDDAVKSLMHLGRTKQTLLDRKEERDFNEFRDEILGKLEQLPDRKLPDSPSEIEKRRGASAAAALLKMETIADEIDNRDPNGPMNRLLVQGATEAATTKDDLTERVLAPLAALYNGLTRKQRARMQDKVTSDRLTWNTLNEGDTRRGRPVTLTRIEWLTVALNTGNLSNLEKMSKGERWPAPVIQAELNRILSKEDWDFVHTVWRQLDTLWPEIARVERDLSGVVPEQVPALDIDTPHGPYKGGYWPVVYDSTRSQRAEDNAKDEANDLFGFRSGIGTPKGHTITRTNATGPISYSLEQILIGHVERVVTRIAYAAWVRDVLRVAKNPKIRGMIDSKLGPEYRAQIEPWLRRQVNGNMIDKRGAAWWDKVLRQFRINLSITAMGFAFSTGVAQTLGLSYSAGRIGARYVGVGLRRMLHPTEGFGAAQEFVFSRSPEMARRGQEVNREIVDLFAGLRDNATMLKRAQAMAFWHIAMIDRYMVSMPTWLGAHQKAMDEGMTDEQASAYADKIVRSSQGSGREKDLAAVQSPNSEAFRYFTMFYTPFNVLFNAQWDAMRAAKRGDFGTSLQLTFWFLIATTLADALMSGDWPEGDEGEPVGFDDLTTWFGRNVFFGLAGGVPIVRDVANFAERSLIGEYSNLENPVSQSVEAVWKSGQQSLQVAQGEKEADGAYLRGMANVTGYIFGIPGGQIGKTGGFLWDVNTGQQDPQSVRDWYSGLTYGRTPAEIEGAKQ